MITVNIKPLSVNSAWQGKRFKTPEYNSYEKAVLLMLPKRIEIPNSPFSITFEFGVSSKLSDWDNPIKPFQDILCKKYGIDDRDIYRGTVSKVLVKKGEEYVKFKIE
ncbi:hypothetical protein [Myroides odoratus]|uniref:hypothetical protein n=1 Tax=Myroides odoratus TaxID=256 RepID=UPI0039B0D675